MSAICTLVLLLVIIILLVLGSALSGWLDRIGPLRHRVVVGIGDLAVDKWAILY